MEPISHQSAAHGVDAPAQTGFTSDVQASHDRRQRLTNVVGDSAPDWRGRSHGYSLLRGAFLSGP